MIKFITHDAIANNIFNQDFCSTTPGIQSWEKELTTTPALSDLFLKRICSDYENLHPKMRKAYALKDLEPQPIFFHFFGKGVSWSVAQQFCQL